ncbi:MAG: cyclic pyranopterin monophosphate synthase MoaC [Planctomycetales bacterium]|nr:cyclic pyranopterin monophosphate synthase MoaC [Planctomycetales bacterium]
MSEAPRRSSHFNEQGSAHMVDVSQKPITARSARAGGWVRMAPETLQVITSGNARKGDVLGIARISGIQAAKRTGDWIPLCHPLPLDGVEVSLEPAGVDLLRIEATVRVTARTGVEMEALTAVSAAALTVYDMCKSMDRAMTIERIELLEKSGGRSGHYRANDSAARSEERVESREEGGERSAM